MNSSVHDVLAFVALFSRPSTLTLPPADVAPLWNWKPGVVVPTPMNPLFKMRAASVAPLLPTWKTMSAPVVPTPVVERSVSGDVVPVPPAIMGANAKLWLMEKSAVPPPAFLNSKTPPVFKKLISVFPELSVFVVTFPSIPILKLINPST